MLVCIRIIELMQICRSFSFKLCPGGFFYYEDCATKIFCISQVVCDGIYDSFAL